MVFNAEKALEFLQQNRISLARIGVAMRWNPGATAADVARVCYLPIEEVESLIAEHNQLQIVGYPLA